MPRYVILEHDYPELHWDLMLEAGEVLRTWRLAAPPQTDERVRADPSFDHRRFYLDYEGPVSGNRGCVKAWDRGTYEALAEDAASIAVRLQGKRLRGAATLLREEGGPWHLRFVAES